MGPGRGPAHTGT